jgi:hypothetical protein
VIDFYLTAEMFIAILPELGLLILAELILVMEFVLPREKRRMLGWLTAGGLFLIVVVSLIAGGLDPNQCSCGEEWYDSIGWLLYSR